MAIYAFDYGVDSFNNSTFVSEGLTLTQQDRSTLWIAIPLAPDSSFYLSGFYEFKGTFASSGTTVTPWRFDAGRSEYLGSRLGALGPSTVLRWSIGRTFLTDFSGKLLSGLYDGARGEIAIGNTTLAASVAYTGLLDKDDALIAISANDQIVSAAPGRYFAPRHLFASLTGRLVEVFPGHDLGFETWGQFDLEQFLSGTQTVYAEPFIEGHLGRNFTWRTWANGELIITGDLKPALAAGGLARFVFPNLRNIVITGDVAWSSGQSGGLLPFIPLMNSPIDGLTTFTFSNILVSTLSFSVTPFDWLTSTFRGSTLLRTSDLIVGSSNVRALPSGSLLGFEASVQAVFRTIADLNMNVLGGAFFPETTHYYQSNASARATVTIFAEILL
ncbi:MAG: hypothetical protein M0001_14220 [Treponema sp.]|nr:hypothetical protein [Treponema sp.]